MNLSFKKLNPLAQSNTKHSLTPSFSVFEQAGLPNARLYWLWLLSLFFWTLPHSSQAEEAVTTPVSQVKFLGLELLSADVESVRSHFWDIGGFSQARATVRQRNVDKFFSWSRIRDSYYVQFRYNPSGKVISVKRLYRPYSQNSGQPNNEIHSGDIALELMQMIGPPTRILKKGWGSSQKYSAYTWQDEKLTIKIDREGGSKLGNTYIEYTVNTNDPFEVAQQENKKENIGRTS